MFKRRWETIDMRYGFVRICVGVTGAVLFLIAFLAWLQPEKLAAKLGVAASNPLGAATLRADLGAFFATAGGLALVAAILRAPRLLTAPLLLIGLALAGRILALELEPLDSAMIPPMVAEAMMAAVFLAGRVLRPTR
jgi:hypothetical protein